MTKEMVRRGKAYNKYRYRRFQALDDSLYIYFFIKDTPGWSTVDDIAAYMEWDRDNHSTRKRIRRICESLVRISRIEYKRAHGVGNTLFYKAYEEIKH